MDSQLKIGVAVDATPLVNFANETKNVALNVDVAATAFGEMSAAAGVTAAQLNALYPTEEAVKAATDEVAASTARATSAMGAARVEMGLLEGSAGMMAGGLARVAAQSAVLGPIIQAAFVPVAAIAFADILYHTGEALVKFYENVVLDKAELEAFAKVEDSVSESTRRLATETESSYIAYLRLVDPVEAAREKLRSLGDQRFTFKVDDEQLKEMPASFAKFVKELSDFPANQLDTQMRRVAGSADYLRNTLAAPVLHGLLSRDELQAQLDLLNKIQAAMTQMQARVGVEQRIGTADLGKAQEEESKKAQEAADKAARAEEEKVQKATSAHEAMLAEQDLYFETLVKNFDAEHRLADEENEMFRKSTEKDVQAAMEAAEKQIAARARYVQEAGRLAEEASLRTITSEQSAAEDAARVQQLKLTGSNVGALGRVRAEQEIAVQLVHQEEKLAADKLAVQLKYIEDSKKILMGGQTEQAFVVNANPEQLSELNTLNSQIEAAQQAHAATMAALQTRETDAVQKSVNEQISIYMRGFDKIDSGLESMTREMLQGSLRTSEAFRRMGESMVISVVTGLEQMALKTIEKELLMTMIHTTQTQAQVAATAAAAGETRAITAETTMSELTHHAVAAAAAAWNALAGIPVIGPALGAAAAAATFVGIMALGAMAGAEQGALVPRDMPIFAHGGEMILPRDLSEGMSGLVKSGGAGGSNTVNLHINALDSANVNDFIGKNSAKISGVLRKAMRNGMRR